MDVVGGTLPCGTMLDDKYRIERLLATGGMGAVYLGTHLRLRKRVAIKVLNPQLSTATMVERFHREAITASQIGHEGIAQVTDMGTSHAGEPFLVMEYLEGESLASRLKRSGPLAIEDACELGCSILEPLAAAHRAGVIHRDLKPDNVFLVQNSRGEMIKLLDFGISRASGLDRQFRLTVTGLVLGTPYYMSPEQARGESEITPAADLYAFGVMLYEMLTGSVPIHAENYNALMYRVTVGDYLPPRRLRPDLPRELERIILHAMAGAPAGRPASAAQLGRALLAFCRPGFCERASVPTSLQGRLLEGETIATAGPPASDAAIDPARFAGSTLPDPPRGDGASRFEDVAADRGTIDDRATRPLRPESTTSNPVASSRLAPRRSRVAPALIGVLLVVVAAGMLVIAYAGDRSVAGIAASRAPADARAPGTIESPPPGSVAAAIAGGRADPQVATEPPTITLRLAVVPSDAAIVVDGSRVAGTEIVVARDDAPHRLRIVAAGYVAYDAALSFSESQRILVQLRRAVTATHDKDTRKLPRTPHATPEPPEPRASHQPSESPGQTDLSAGSGERSERIEIKSPYR